MWAGVIRAAEALFGLALFDPCGKDRELLLELVAAAVGTFPVSAAFG